VPGTAPLKLYRRLLKEYGPQGWWPARTTFEMMVGAVLTQNTSWSNVEKAIANLRREGCLKPVKMAALTHREIARMIKPAGYFNVKAGRIRNLLDFLSSECGMDTRLLGKTDAKRLREKLLGVNGIGPETCDSILLYAFGKPFFVIDAYTRRVFSRLGMSKADTQYGELQDYFTANLPRSAKIYNEYHALIVKLGKEVCRKRPLCGECPVREYCRNGSPVCYNKAKGDRHGKKTG